MFGRIFEHFAYGQLTISACITNHSQHQGNRFSRYIILTIHTSSRICGVAVLYTGCRRSWKFKMEFTYDPSCDGKFAANNRLVCGYKFEHTNTMHVIPRKHFFSVSSISEAFATRSLRRCVLWQQSIDHMVVWSLSSKTPSKGFELTY